MDPEISAMTKIAEALEDLNPAARSRALRWAADKYEVVFTETSPQKTNGGAVDTPEVGKTGDYDEQPANYESLAELFSDASPSTSAEKVLVGGYWHQEILGQTELTSAALNKDLKDLGHGITGINDKFDTLMGTKPQLAIQLKKSGSAKQARKKYKITKAGIARVKEMLG